MFTGRSVRPMNELLCKPGIHCLRGGESCVFFRLLMLTVGLRTFIVSEPYPAAASVQTQTLQIREWNASSSASATTLTWRWNLSHESRQQRSGVIFDYNNNAIYHPFHACRRRRGVYTARDRVASKWGRVCRKSTPAKSGQRDARSSSVGRDVRQFAAARGHRSPCVVRSRCFTLIVGPRGLGDSTAAPGNRSSIEVTVNVTRRSGQKPPFV